MEIENSASLRRTNVVEEARAIYAIDLFSTRKCRLAVGRLKQTTDWQDAQVLVAGDDGSPIPVPNPEMRMARLFTGPDEIVSEFESRIEDVVFPLVKSLWRVELSQHSEIQVVRYGPSGHYRPHADGGYFMNERYFTLICYLNDDFTGGNTSFPSLPYTVRPKAGRVLLFPSRFVHCAEPVIAGEKFVMVSWLTAPPPVDWLKRS
jgi:hypothetical protein